MKRIDAHAHIGQIMNFNMTPEMILESMAKYEIDFTLLSNGEAAEVDHQQQPIPLHEQYSQIEANQKTIDFVAHYPDKLGALLWIKPVTEGCTAEFETFVAHNRQLIYGLKVHPYHSKFAFNDPRMFPYFELAKKYQLPVLTHTATDMESSPELVAEVARQYPEVNFVMGHMGLGSDNEAAFALMAEIPNLYGDTAWVFPERIARGIAVCGADKILFGSDNPINGVDTYNDEVFYIPYFTTLQQQLLPDDYAKIMAHNAQKVYRLP